MTDQSDTTHIWRSKDYDFPCTPTGETSTDTTGRVYSRVMTSDGAFSTVPEDELIMQTNSSIADTEFLTCLVDHCRPGIARALKAALREILAGKPTIAVVMAPRYGKSHFIRQLAIELIERNLAGACITLEPWKFLRNQLNADDKIQKMVEHHAIGNAVIRPKAIVRDILTGKIDPDFYTATPHRHWWGLTISQAYTPHTRTILLNLAVQFKQEKRPLVVFIDEAHLLSIGDHGWGKLAAELKMAGATIILLTGTPERPDNIAPYGFKTEEVSRKDLEYKVRTPIDDNNIRIDYYEAEKVQYRIIPDVPMVGLQQAWNEKALTKLQHRLFTFKADGELIGDLTSNTSRRALAVALRDAETIRVAVREMLDELRLRRQTDGTHGVAAPTTAAFVLVGNDRSDDDGNDWHAREVKRIIIQEWPNFLPGKPNIQIVTRHTEGEDSDKAAETIQAFCDGVGDIIIVKQMGGVGLEAERLKVGLDLSTVRAKGNTTQRWLRLATLWGDTTHGTMILPNEPSTMRLWQAIVEEQGGQYTIENATLVDSKVVKNKHEPKIKPIITDPQRAGSIDQNLRLVEANLDQKLDAILLRSPIFAIRFTRRELADEYEKGTFSGISLDNVKTTSETPTVAIFDADTEVAKKQEHINRQCTDLANREATYMKGAPPEQNEAWINLRKRGMAEAKNYADIRGELGSCRDINKLMKAEEWLEARLGRS